MTLPKLFDWYSEDFGGKEKVLLWLLGVLPEEQREELRVLIEAEYDSPVLGREHSNKGLQDGPTGLDSEDLDYVEVPFEPRSAVVRLTFCMHICVAAWLRGCVTDRVPTIAIHCCT